MKLIGLPDEFNKNLYYINIDTIAYCTAYVDGNTGEVKEGLCWLTFVNSHNLIIGKNQEDTIKLISMRKVL